MVGSGGSADDHQSACSWGANWDVLEHGVGLNGVSVETVWSSLSW